jgi:TonB-dependent SusC/RagA subfamily outer membrane receptor
MKSVVLSCLVLLSFSSCLVVKIYESPAHPQQAVPSKPNEVHRSMIPSGKVIELGKQGSSEILFFGKEQSPKKVFFKSDSLFTGTATWIEDEPKQHIFISKTDKETPLYVIDGKIEKNSDAMKALDPNQIESINVLKGESAIKKYGEKGASGVIEILTKKE